MVVSNYSLKIDDLINTAVFEVAGTACFLWKHMDDAHIIYDTRSGHSQALNDFSREIFDIIADKPSCLSDIMLEIQNILGRALAEDLKKQIEQTVIEFDNMGLIKPVKSGIRA